MHGVVAALGAADGVRRAGVVRAGDERVVAALALVDADRVDRQQVEHVEAVVGDLGHERLDGLQAAPRAREQLIPGAEARLHAVDLERQRVERRRRPCAPSWSPSPRTAPARARRRTSPDAARPASASTPWACSIEPRASPCARVQRALQQHDALRQLAREVLVDVGLDLAAQLVVPGGPHVRPRLDRELPAARSSRRRSCRPSGRRARCASKAVIGVSSQRVPPGALYLTTARSFSCPSRKMSASTATVSPTVRLGAYRPQSMTGRRMRNPDAPWRFVAFGGGHPAVEYPTSSIYEPLS